MTEPSIRRRFGLALFAVAASGLLLHGQLADALVVRGDECLYRASLRQSLRYYRRAIWLDPTNGVAIDRLLFVAMMLRDQTLLRDGIRSSSQYLLARPEDDVVRLDRAMAYRATADPGSALADFAVVGRRAHDPRAFTFAGFAAQELGQPSRARQFWRSALAVQPGFPAAKHALQRTFDGP